MKKIFSRFMLIFFLAFMTFCASAEEEKESATVTLTVDDAVEYANKHSRTIRSAMIDVDSKADAMNHSLNAFLPDVSFSGTITRPNDGSADRAIDNYSAIGSASISVNWGLSIIQKVKKANIDYKNGLITWEEAVRQNERDVKKVFYSLLLQQKTLETDKASLSNTQKRYWSTDKSYRNGGTSRINALQSRVTYQNMKRDVEKEEIALNRQLREFASILGLSPDTELILSGSLETEILVLNKEELLSMYSAYQSQIESLELQIKSLDAQMTGLNLDSWTPTLSFNYSTKQTMTGLDNSWIDGSSWTDRGSGSLSLTWNFTNVLPFSNNRLKYHDLERQKEKLELQLEQKRDDILLDSQKLFDELESSAVSLESCRENITLASQSYNLVSRAYNAGSADLIEVRDAEEQLNKSRLAEQSELYTYICALTDLEYMLNLPKDWRNK